MISFEKYQLDNGLTVILQPDVTTPIAAVNICYNVGSRDEHSERTGFAHLFEHLMFGGSVNVPSYDKVLQRVGGDNNAFTSVDITNYYLTLPAQNIETAFYLESDRMNELAFNKKSFDVQRNVVVEEFKQSYLNQPYGDAMLLLKPLAYKVHPYRWNTIGISPQHIQDATMDEVKEFFYTFYRPNNAVITVSGNIQTDECKRMVNHWFGNIPMGKSYHRCLPQEPEQTQSRFMEVERDVPCDCIYKAYKMCKRTHPDFYAVDLLSDILSNGDSARLTQKLVNESKLFSSVNAYVSGTFDEGLFMISGYVNPGTDLVTADRAIQEQLCVLKEQKIRDYELQKVKNKVQTILDYAELAVQDKAMNLSVFEVMSQAEDINKEEKKYADISSEHMQKTAQNVFNEPSCSTLYYRARKKMQ
ncbi:MAG: insulinase family protein [Bacteroidales bacterium]|nr:insulinase family protein [Bacteroidales bacterium]